jgi:hypothetical protein
MLTPNNDLEPIDPRAAQQLFLKNKATVCVDKTVQAHRYRPNHFVRWCDEQEITNLNNLTGDDNVRDVMLEEDRAEELLESLRGTRQPPERGLVTIQSSVYFGFTSVCKRGCPAKLLLFLIRSF